MTGNTGKTARRPISHALCYNYYWNWLNLSLFLMFFLLNFPRHLLCDTFSGSFTVLFWLFSHPRKHSPDAVPLAVKTMKTKGDAFSLHERQKNIFRIQLSRLELTVIKKKKKAEAMAAVGVTGVVWEPSIHITVCSSSVHFSALNILVGIFFLDWHSSSENLKHPNMVSIFDVKALELRSHHTATEAVAYIRRAAVATTWDCSCNCCFFLLPP